MSIKDQLADELSNIANAIREKTGDEAQLTIPEMAPAIEDITAGDDIAFTFTGVTDISSFVRGYSYLDVDGSETITFDRPIENLIGGSARVTLTSERDTFIASPYPSAAVDNPTSLNFSIPGNIVSVEYKSLTGKRVSKSYTFKVYETYVEITLSFRNRQDATLNPSVFSRADSLDSFAISILERTPEQLFEKFNKVA